MDTDPDPDGVQTVFAVPDSNLVATTLEVYLDGELVTTDSEDLAKGSFVLPAPDEGQKLRASYYFQWFTDGDLEEFLTQALQFLGFDSVTDGTIPVGLRTVIISLAAYYAYMKKAAESAPALDASASGFTSDTSKEHPYWMDLARQAWEMFEAELETFNENPVAAIKPAMKFTAFKMARYVPRT